MGSNQGTNCKYECQCGNDGLFYDPSYLMYVVLYIFPQEMCRFGITKVSLTPKLY